MSFYLSVVVASTLILIALILNVYFSDPGFIKPGNLEESNYHNLIPIAIVGGKNFLLKYCGSCNIVRDLRVFHCKYCNLCVLRHGKYFIAKINRPSLSVAKYVYWSIKSQEIYLSYVIFDFSCFYYYRIYSFKS